MIILVSNTLLLFLVQSIQIHESQNKMSQGHEQKKWMINVSPFNEINRQWNTNLNCEILLIFCIKLAIGF